jgi:Tol biopolymer transport system component
MIEIISVTKGGNNLSSMPVLSADGAKMVFQSSATNLTLGDTNNQTDLFVKNLGTGNLTNLTALGTSDSSASTISADGGMVAFQSKSSNLVDGDGNGEYDIFVKDLDTGALTNLTKDGNGISSAPVLSADGSVVAFQSLASNLVDGDTNERSDVFVMDLRTGGLTNLTKDGNGDSSDPSLSTDSTRVAFGSTASNLVAGDEYFFSDVFVASLDAPSANRPPWWSRPWRTRRPSLGGRLITWFLKRPSRTRTGIPSRSLRRLPTAQTYQIGWTSAATVFRGQSRPRHSAPLSASR